MVDYTTLLHELPDSLRNEVVSAVGSTHNLSLVQILSRYRAKANRLTAEKRSQYRGYRDVSGIFGDGPLVKAQMDFLKAVVDGRYNTRRLRDRYVGESIAYLTRFSEALVGLQAQAEQAARQQAEEAARQQARRQAEEAARQQAQRQAEEAARQKAARQQAQRQAEETARQQAQRQAEEADRLRAQRQAQRGAFLQTVAPVQQAAVEKLLQQAKAKRAAVEHTGVILGEKGKEILWLPGPPAASELEKARRQLNEDVDQAIAGFIAAMDFDAGITASEAFNAMLYALNLNSADIPAFSR